MAGSISALVAIGLVIATIGSASAEPSAGDWLKLRTCESGGNYAINTGNGYYGAYQFDLGTWRSVGGSGLPSDASPATQDALAYKLWQERGWSPWTCASIVGLPAGGSGGPARQVAVAPKPKPVVLAGRLESIAYNTNSARIVVSGWAADQNTSAYTSTVKVTVNGVTAMAKANTARADINRAANLTGRHGFSVSIPAVAGHYKVCATIMPRGSSASKSLGCRNVYVPVAIRSRAAIKLVSGKVLVKGWVYDNSAANRSTKIVVAVNTAHYTVIAGQSSPDVDTAFAIGGNHRFASTFKLNKGKNIVCVYAYPAGAGNSKRLGCSTIRV